MTRRSVTNDARRFHLLSAGLLALVALLPGVLSAQSALAQQGSGAWLLQPLTSWNQPGMSLPAPIAVPQAGPGNPSCATTTRYAETPEDQDLVNAGWGLSAPYQAGWGIVVVLGEASEDGMCRPLGYNYFVFVDGSFAGTLSPTPMEPRTSGSGLLTGFTANQVSARFVRYTPNDALCCPSLPAVDVDYAVQRMSGGPVVTPSSSYMEGGSGS